MIHMIIHRQFAIRALSAGYLFELFILRHTQMRKPQDIIFVSMTDSHITTALFIVVSSIEIHIHQILKLYAEQFNTHIYIYIYIYTYTYMQYFS